MIRTDLLVIGSGVAGLYAALCATARGMNTTLLTKDTLADSNSRYAQGGLSAVGPHGIAAGDSVASHVADTLRAGAGLNDEDAVALMCSTAWEHVQRLLGAGALFDADSDGDLALGLEAAHSHPRILHAGGDATGKGLTEALIAACRLEEADGKLEIREHAFVTDLLTEANPEADGPTPGGTRVSGARVLGADGGIEEIGAHAVLLATGGAGQLFAATTNPAGATGDGAALAYRVGAALADAEFIQFHPTLVSPGGFMVSEAVRGEGAVLINQDGERFMRRIHPAAELAPRDVVARAIHAVRAEGGTVHLDARDVEKTRGPGFLARRFPSITAELAKLGHDLATGPVPVTPAAHYWMGGVLTNDAGSTSIPGLYAAGEAACTGVHGANRLASNSLLEALVFAWRTVVNLPGNPGQNAPERSLPEHSGSITMLDVPGPDTTTPKGTGTEMELAALQGLAQRYLGVERTESGLRAALGQLRSWRVHGTDRAAHERDNLRTVAMLVATAALRREASIGAHHRLDAPRNASATQGTSPRYAQRALRTTTQLNLRTKTLV
ncbi:MAG: L-aspartate oxidase [Micrococcaceae bacterium]|nr:L-aspartate oxidase [Micrococcaceae bacterium]